MSKDKKINIKLMRIKNEVGFWSGLASSIIAIVELFTDLPTWFKITWSVCISAFIVSLSISFLMWIIENFSIKKELLSQHDKHLYGYSEKIHNCLHQIKDSICYEAKDISNRNFFSALCQNLCNEMEKVFSTLWSDKDVSVCLKKIIVNEESDPIDTWEVRTIARSSNAQQNRRQLDNKNYKIIDNKDFYVIASPNYPDSLFSSPNMEKIEDDFLKQYGMKYDNSTDNYLSFYKSTIVVPIRISFENAHEIIRKRCTSSDTTYNIIGFLCIDSINKYDEKIDVFVAGTEIARAFADALYKLFENNYIYTIQEEEKKYEGDS